MSNETTLYIQTGLPIPFIVNNALSITKGEILQLSGSFNAYPCKDVDKNYAPCVAGIAAEDHIANSGITTIAVYREGFFKGTASGSIAFGDPINVLSGGSALGYPNVLFSISGSTGMSGSRVLGTAMETVATGGTFIFELKSQVAGYIGS